METAAAGVLLVSLLFLLVLSSAVEVSLEYGRDGLHVGVRALGGLVRRCLAVSGKESGDARREPVGEVRRLRLALALFRRFQRPGLHLLQKTRLGQLEVDLAVGLERPDLTAWSVGGLWAVGGSLASLVSCLVAPGSTRPRIRVTPCFGRAHFALAVRGRLRVRVWHLLAALWQAWPAWREMRMPRLHKFLVPGHIKACRKEPVANTKTR